LLCGRGRILFIVGSLGQRSRSLTINIIFDNRVVWVIRSKVKVTYYK
jgi:hypothetical protein